MMTCAPASAQSRSEQTGLVGTDRYMLDVTFVGWRGGRVVSAFQRRGECSPYIRLPYIAGNEE